MSLNELRSLIRRLESVQPPVEYLIDDNENDIEATTSTQSLLESYKNARDEYLARRVKRALLDHLQTFDGKTFPKPDNVPTQEDLNKLREERDRKIAEIQEKVKLINSKKLEIQAKYSLFQTRREQCQEMFHELESNNDDNDSDNNDKMEEFNEEEYQTQREKLAALQARRAEVEMQLRAVNQENMEVQRLIHEKKGAIKTVRTSRSSNLDVSEQSLEKIQDMNEKLKAELEEAKEAKEMYENLRRILEELFGVRILSIQRESNGENRMKITLEILTKHIVEILIQKSNLEKLEKSYGGVQVCSAKLISNATIKAPTSKETGESTVHLDIPDLSDIVRVSNNRQWQDDNLQFVVRETIARCTIIERRVQLLSELQDIVVTKIGRLYDSESESSFGGEDQEVICSFNDEQITVLLRLTPDCPLVKGSVYIDQMVGLGGWDPDEVEKLKDSVNAKGFKDPVSLIRTLQEDIHQLQEAGVQFPQTPSLPKRNPDFET